MAQEFVVRVPREIKKQFNVMRFNAALNMDIAKLQDTKHCKMERENLFKEVKGGDLEEEQPEFGAGSEYGRKEREEARRRRFEKRKHKQNNSPWILKVGGKQGKKYKGIREGGVSENTSYYVFFQAPDGAFEAFPVNEWYNFTPFQRYKALSAEEAEEKFNKRDQILNYFQLKHMTKKEEDSVDETKAKVQRSIKKDFKVSDMDDWYNSDNDNISEGDSDEEDRKPSKANLKGKKGKEKRKKDDSDNDDNEPLEDSDEGDYDDKEVDYMDSGSSSSSESETEKVDIKGVADESALRDSSEDEDEEENKEQNNEQNEDGKTNDDEKKIKEEGDSLSGSDFDSDNPDDLDISKSALLIQNKKKVKADRDESTSNEAKSANGNKETSDGNKGESSGLKFKHKLENVGPGPSHKRQRVDKPKSDELLDSITQDVRRYLLRKPHTAIELLKLCKNKVHKRDKLGEIMGIVLKNLNPEKRKDHNGKITFFLRNA